MMHIKAGVKLIGAKPELLIGLMIVRDVFMKYNVDLTLTAITDGKHSRGSLHYAGYAADLRTRDIAKELIPKIIEDSKISLGDEFDIIFESTHIHLEWQPK